jgi:hypothetical protein
MSEIWYRDPLAAMGPKALHKFFPTTHMHIRDQLNAVVRFALYYSIALMLVTRRLGCLRIFIAVALLSVIVYEVYRRRGPLGLVDTAHFEQNGVRCSPPSRDNPHMNVMLADYSKPQRPPACDVTIPSIAARVVAATPPVPNDDPFSEGRMDRQFYTMPNTTIPNDQSGYVDFLYGNGDSGLKRR